MKLLRLGIKLQDNLCKMQIYLLGELQFGLLSFSNAYQVHGGVVLLVLTTLQPLLELLSDERDEEITRRRYLRMTHRKGDRHIVNILH